MLKLRQRHPDADVRALHLAWDGPCRALLDHRADAVICRLPLETRGLHVTILYDEPQVLLVPRDHRLAGKESVTLDDIAGKPMPMLAHSMWNVHWRVDPRPDETPAPGGPFVNALEDKLEVIAAGQAAAIVSAGLRAEGMHPELIAIPLDGVEPCRVVLATRVGDRNRLVAALAKFARDSLTGPGSDAESPA